MKVVFTMWRHTQLVVLVALSAAIGNLIGDFFGTLTLGSVGGFVENFFLAYLPYKMWGAYIRSDENIETNVDSGKKFGCTYW